MKKNNGNKRLRLFDITRDGKGISKSSSELGWGLKRFFITFKDNFNKRLTIGIILILGWVVASFGFINIVGNLYGAVGVISAMFPLVFFIKKMKKSDILRKNKKNGV